MFTENIDAMRKYKLNIWIFAERNIVTLMDFHEKLRNFTDLKMAHN